MYRNSHKVRWTKAKANFETADSIRSDITNISFVWMEFRSIDDIQGVPNLKRKGLIYRN